MGVYSCYFTFPFGSSEMEKMTLLIYKAIAKNSFYTWESLEDLLDSCSLL